ncbi:secretory lipase-domain-containing protein [Aspergillus pseudonomiae]|uniref:Secretory lipase-domain-containing protein n=1 Tax=Aspergillus pseudonomiae TaxID=1506151 RepID=A0A5N6I956_9EURO|nr:secretory lipase-domain-containing protein [Aspergillus pseudonomiae]KAB8263066.1 secretory lipase-domain-containing protein [Aspergillus pseudonomiae]KAE8408685.1 secretory lipase-domain-containing protein [Aspergillus pseudonomiae]
MLGLGSLLSFFFVFATCLAYPGGLASRATVTPPSTDPFYEPPAGYENEDPGTILRYRNVPHPIALIDPIKIKLEAAYQILYRSTDNWDNATATVTTVLVPENANTSRLLSYQIPEDSSAVNCAPSYVLQTGIEDNDLLSKVGIQSHTVLFRAALEKGWIVSIPDHEGPKAAFLANRRAGHAVLDGIRAVLRSSDFTTVSPNASVAMWGYSGGSLASGFAAELQPTYAPDLDMIVGAALGGLIGDIEVVTYTVNKGPFVGLDFGGFNGIAHEYPDIAALYKEQLIESKKAKFYDANHNCFVANVIEYPFQDIFSYFKDPSILSYPQMQQALKDNNLGQNPPKIPIFVYKGALDEISPASTAEIVASRYCAGGTAVKYKNVLTHEHILLQVDGFLEAFAWLEERMNGEAIQSDCSHTDELLPLSEPGSLGVIVPTVEGVGKDVVGTILG